jgi:predicted acetyltransferase
MTFEIGPLNKEHIPAFRQAVTAGFGEDVDMGDESWAERFAALFKLDRMFPVFDGETIVGTGGDFGLVITVPGGAQVPMSGLTVITVLPTHTRKGVLTAMMREHFDQARDRGEPLGGLWASEVPIYGRYGYGAAVVMHDIKLDARQTGRGGIEPEVSVRLVDGDEAKDVLPRIYANAQLTRPGMFQRSADWWTHRLFYDPEKWREGASALRHALAEVHGEPVGYVSYRQKSNWGGLLSEGEVRITELIPITDAGYRALWHFATSIDLFPIVKYWNTPADDPLHFLVRDGRAIATSGVSDSLWVRLIDVPAALECRAYSGGGALVLRIIDDFCHWNEGTYRLSIDAGSATCERVVTEPDITMTVSTLGALFMGGRDAGGLARAGLIDGDREALSRLNTVFRSRPDPWCPEVF